ncbi:MAG: hypothetical protein AAGI17_05535 [Planctomycetota bacterium]
MHTDRTFWLKLLFLTTCALCATTLFPTAVHLDNVQEGLRVLPAAEMAQRNDWLLPTLHGETYLAKPPLIYWLIRLLMPLCSWIGGEPNPYAASELAARIIVGLAGTLTVLLTYLAGKDLLRDDTTLVPGPRSPVPVREADPAFLAACTLCGGPLLIHQSRTAEIDILIAPLTLLGVWIGHKAIASRAQSGRTDFTRVAMLCGVFGLLALAKGPPGMIILAIALALGPAAHAAFAVRPHLRLGSLGRLLPIAAGLALFTTFAVLRTSELTDPLSVLGMTLSSSLLALLVWTIARALRYRDRLVDWYKGLHAVHIAATPAIGLGILWLWFAALANRIGWDTLQSAGNKEATDNLRVLVPNATTQYTEAVLYAAGLGSIAFVALLIWIAKDRPRLPRGVWTCLAWALGTVLVFGLAGRGTARYITAVWPALALAGGAWIAAAIRDIPWAKHLPRIIPTVTALTCLGALAWYGVLPSGLPDRGQRSSPKFMMSFLAGTKARNADPEPPGLDRPPTPDAVATLGIWDPNIDIYARQYGLDPLGHFFKRGQRRYGLGPPTLAETLKSYDGVVALIVPEDVKIPRSIKAVPDEWQADGDDYLELWYGEAGRTPTNVWIVSPDP